MLYFYLVDFLFRMCEQCREVAESIAVEHHLGLFIGASDYVSNSPQSSSLVVERECQSGSSIVSPYKEFLFINSQE